MLLPSASEMVLLEHAVPFSQRGSCSQRTNANRNDRATIPLPSAGPVPQRPHAAKNFLARESAIYRGVSGRARISNISMPIIKEDRLIAEKYRTISENVTPERLAEILSNRAQNYESPQRVVIQTHYGDEVLPIIEVWDHQGTLYISVDAQK